MCPPTAWGSVSDSQPRAAGRHSRVCEDILAAARHAKDTDSVIPAKAGIQEPIEALWIPACAGMTERVCLLTQHTRHRSTAAKSSQRHIPVSPTFLLTNTDKSYIENSHNRWGAAGRFDPKCSAGGDISSPARRLRRVALGADCLRRRGLRHKLLGALFLTVFGSTEPGRETFEGVMLKHGGRS